MKNAFTLAETLITLSIIGIIAILTFVNLVRVKPDQNVIKYKKAFYGTQEIIKSLANDYTKYPDAGNVLKAPDAAAANGKTYGQYLCYQVAANANTTGAINCSATAVGTGYNGKFENGNYEFKLNDGTAFTGFNQIFEDEDSDDMTSDSITVCVDVNGLNNAPNKGCDAGDVNVKNRDQFKMRIHQDGKVSTGDGAEWEKENDILQSTGVNTKK